MTSNPIFPLILILLGLAVLAWPEQDAVMLVQLSGSHGPSFPDMIGIGILMLGYLPLAWKIIAGREKLRSRLKSFYPVSIVVVLVAFTIIATALVLEVEWLLWSAVAVATLTQATLIYLAYQRT